MGFKLRPGTSVFGNVTFTPGTNENYVAPPVHQGPPPMTVGWSYAGLSESERVAPASNGMQLYRHDQPYTNAHSNRTLHNLPEYLEGLPFTVESASPSSENGIQGTTNAFEEYTFNTSGTLYLILRADWGGYNPSTLELQLSDNNIGSTGVLDPSTWTCVEDSVGYMGGGGDYGTYVFSKSVESGTHSLNNLYYYAFKADPAPESAPAPAPEPAPEPELPVIVMLDGNNQFGYSWNSYTNNPTAHPSEDPPSIRSIVSEGLRIQAQTNNSWGVWLSNTYPDQLAIGQKVKITVSWSNLDNDGRIELDAVPTGFVDSSLSSSNMQTIRDEGGPESGSEVVSFETSSENWYMIKAAAFNTGSGSVTIEKVEIFDAG